MNEPLFESSAGAAKVTVAMGGNMDKPTFEGIVHEHDRFIRRTLSSHGVRKLDLEDVVQEVLTGVHRGLPAFDPSKATRPEGAVRVWLFGICNRQAANHRRALRRRAEDLRDTRELEGVQSASKSAEDQLLVRERDAHLASALSELEPGRRAVIVAHELQGIPMGEIARALKIPVNTAWNRLRLARADVKAALELAPRSHDPGHLSPPRRTIKGTP